MITCDSHGREIWEVDKDRISDKQLMASTEIRNTLRAILGITVSPRIFSPSEGITQTLAQMYAAAFSHRNKCKNNA